MKVIEGDVPLLGEHPNFAMLIAIRLFGVRSWFADTTDEAAKSIKEWGVNKKEMPKKDKFWRGIKRIYAVLPT